MTPDLRRQIARELFEAISALKGSSWLLGHIGAWGDGDSTDAGFLADLKNYNRSQPTAACAPVALTAPGSGPHRERGTPRV